MKTCPKNGNPCGRFACKDEEECPQEEGAPLMPLIVPALAIAGAVLYDTLCPKREPLTPRVIEEVLRTTPGIEVYDRPEDADEECPHVNSRVPEADGSFYCDDCKTDVEPPEPP